MSIYRPIQQKDNNGVIIPFSFANIQARQSLAGTNNITYIGYARSNIDADQPAWMIIKQTFDSSGNIVHVQHAVNGDSQQADYDQIWDNSTALTITSVTKAAIGVVTIEGHGLSTGDLIEIEGSDMTELNSDGYGGNAYLVKKIDDDTFSLVSPSTKLDVNTSAFINAGTEGSVFKRTYATLNYA